MNINMELYFVDSSSSITPGINKYSLTLRRLKNVTDYPRKLSPVATIVLIIPLHVPEKKNRGTQNLTNPIYHKIGHDSPQPNRTV